MSTLLDVHGRPLSQPKPPEMMTAVKFIRKLAEEMGGIQRPQGQAMHRLAAHFIKLQEELERVSHLHDTQGDHTPERITAAAQGIYLVAADRMEAASGKRPVDWGLLPETEAEMYRIMAMAALGAPCYPPVASDQDRQVNAG